MKREKIFQLKTPLVQLSRANKIKRFIKIVV